jgi:hypothetical protein
VVEECRLLGYSDLFQTANGVRPVAVLLRQYNTTTAQVTDNTLITNTQNNTTKNKQNKHKHISL